ncbi:MAG: response regulator [Flavobacteriaceae bacterium]|nr:response regulator [Flavobacteriaceae bacterium]
MRSTFYLIIILSLFSFITYSQTNQVLQDSIDTKLITAKEKKRLLNFDQAIDLYNEVIQLAAINESEISTANALSQIANIYLQTNKNDKAIEMLTRAAQIQRRINDEEGVSSTYNTYGLVYTSQKDYQKALEYFEIAQSKFEELGLSASVAKVIKNKGVLYSEQGNYITANQLMDDAIKLSEKTENDYITASILIEKAKILVKLNNQDRAFDVIDRAFKLAQKNDFQVLAIETKKVLSDVYQTMGNYRRAYDNLKIHNELRDEVYSINKEQLNLEAQARLDADEKNRLIEKMNKESLDKEQQLQRNRITSYLVFALGAILLLFTISLYRNNKNRSKSNALLKKKNVELRKANNAKAQFLSTVTHELRTPLYAVTGLTDILLDKNPTTEQKEHLKSLKFSGDYLLNFINDILHINKIEANKLEVEKTPFNVKKLINSVIIAFNSSEKNNGNDIMFEFDKHSPNMLLGDSVKLSQILFNLVGNAIKFTEKGKIWIRVINMGISNNEVNFKFEIEDTGIGISEEKLDEIFESFSQGSIQINRKYGGTGLGLTIVRNLLDLLGSKIQLKSKEGQGTMFYFDLSFEIAPETIEKVSETPVYKTFDILIGKKILIVEDIKVNQLITQKILDKQKIISDIIDNGTDAVDMVKKGSYDLVLMDIHMPGISGLEATKLIRRFDQDIPIIALTAITIDDKMDDFYQAGFDDILSKPFKPNDLFDKINALIVKKPLKSRL